MNMKGFLVHALQALGNSVLLENKFSRNSSNEKPLEEQQLQLFYCNVWNDEKTSL